MDLDDIIRKDASDVDPAPGSLLIANPVMSDSYFSRAVVLMLAKEDGDMGIVLNQPTNITLDLIIPGIGENLPVFCGGPVDHERMFMLHRLPHIFEGSMRVCGDIYLGGNFEQLRKYLASGEPVEDNLRFYLGYSGWDAAQLTTELINNYWAVNPKPEYSDLLRDTGDGYWRREVARLGENYRSWLVVPENPSMN